MAQRSSNRQVEHDTAVRLLAAQWSNPAKYQISVNPDGEKNRWVGSSHEYPDVIAWKSVNGAETAVWIVEVETADSVNEHEASTQWLQYAATGVPLSLAVPAGSGTAAYRLAEKFGVSVQKVFEFEYAGGALQVAEVSKPPLAALRY